MQGQYKTHEDKRDISKTNNSDQQGWNIQVENIVKHKKLKDRASSIADGKKIHLTGSTTRTEKNWKSNVFGEPI